MDDLSFPNIKAVMAHLKSTGWKVSQASVYQHANDGKIRPGKDGLYHAKDVKRYARAFLKLIDPGKPVNIDLENYQEGRTNAEVGKMEAQGQLWKLKTLIESGAYIPRSDYESRLVDRAIIFKSDIENFCQGKAGDIVQICRGNDRRIPELMEYLTDRFINWMDMIVKPKEILITIKSSGDCEVTTEEKTLIPEL